VQAKKCNNVMWTLHESGKVTHLPHQTARRLGNWYPYPPTFSWVKGAGALCYCTGCRLPTPTFSASSAARKRNVPGMHSLVNVHRGSKGRTCHTIQRAADPRT
jgi:hypothetical protein